MQTDGTVCFCLLLLLFFFLDCTRKIVYQARDNVLYRFAKHTPGRFQVQLTKNCGFGDPGNLQNPKTRLRAPF